MVYQMFELNGKLESGYVNEQLFMECSCVVGRISDDVLANVQGQCVSLETF